MVPTVPLPATDKDSLLVMFWNLENFFDYRNDSLSVSDAEFSSLGQRHWTKKRFYTKCNAISKSVFSIADKTNAFPDIIGFAELENALVINRLIYSTLLRKLNYGIIHYESSDPRGIDVGLVYRKEHLSPIASKAYSIRNILPNGDFDTLVIRTRDILWAQFETRRGDTLNCLVNHHPSKYGGSLSVHRREAAVRTLNRLKDSLISAGSVNIVAMGDFNEVAEDGIFDILEKKADFVNLGRKIKSGTEGSIKFNGKWELIDMFFVSNSLYHSEMEIIKLPFLMERDKKFSGFKPRRTYVGPRYNGGVSDHCPIIVRLKL